MTATQAAFDDFLQHCESRGLSTKTVSYYTQQVSKLVTWLKQRGITELENVTADDLRRYLVHLRKSGIAPASQHSGARAMRAWLNWCEKQDKLTVNPMRKVTMPKRPQTRRPAVSLDDVRRILEACEDARDPLRERAIVLVLTDTGIRASELCALRVGDLEGNRLFVRHGKGDKSRPVFVGDVTQRALEDYLSTRPGVHTNEPLFLSHETGSALQYIGLHEILQRLGKRAGVAVACHGLRRTFAVESLRAGCDLVRLAKLMGHSDLEMFEKHYLPLLEDDLAAAHRTTSPGDRL